MPVTVVFSYVFLERVLPQSLNLSSTTLSSLFSSNLIDTSIRFFRFYSVYFGPPALWLFDRLSDLGDGSYAVLDFCSARFYFPLFCLSSQRS
jgi:hypothetical protein